MADVKWIKILTDIFDDEKILLIETLPEADSIIVIWFKILCLAGKQNNSGVFVMNERMPYNEKMFATIFRRKESTVQLALKTFEEFGMIEIIDGAVTIPNWGKHQNLDKIESKNEYMRKYMAEYRSKQKLLACKTNSKSNSKSNVRQADKNRLDKNRLDKSTVHSDKPNDDGFDTFWAAYPRKEGKKTAQAAWAKIKNPDIDLILDAISKQKKTIQWTKEKGSFIPHPTTWLNQERWNDDVDIEVKKLSAEGREVHDYKIPY